MRSEGVTTLVTEAKQARDRAGAAFKKKEQQLREGEQAVAEYQAALAATREKTARCGRAGWHETRP